MKDKYNIKWEALFIEDSKKINTIIKNLDLNSEELENKVINYHITTEFNPKIKHYDFYGVSAIITIKGYVIDYDIENPYHSDKTSAKGFVVSDIQTTNKELQDYINSIDKKFHVTTSYSCAAVDMNYADYNKIIPYKFKVVAKFGGYDINLKQVIFNK